MTTSNPPWPTRKTIRWERNATRTVDALASLSDDYADIESDVESVLELASTKLASFLVGKQILVHRYPVKDDSDVMIFWRPVNENLISVFYVRLEDPDMNELLVAYEEDIVGFYEEE